MKIYVIRHGITQLNKKKIVNGEIDEPLAPEGLNQAKTLMPIIPASVIHIYSSPLIRARQTAEILSSTKRLFSLHEELSEIRMGNLAGKSWESMENGLELKKKHRTVKFDYRPYGGESVKEVKKRLIEFLKKINGKHNDNETLTVTHGGIIRLLNFLETGEAVYETEKHLSLLTFDLDKMLKKFYNITFVIFALLYLVPQLD